jgi:hypothetical protein
VPKTHAERQRDYWERQHATVRHQADRISELEAALEAERVMLQAEVDTVRSELDAALAEVERLTASQCRHPAAAIDNGTCGACGTELW